MQGYWTRMGVRLAKGTINGWEFQQGGDEYVTITWDEVYLKSSHGYVAPGWQLIVPARSIELIGE